MTDRSNTVSGLIEKRRELAGYIEYLQNELRKAAGDLDHLDATIHLFDPDIELEDIQGRPYPPRHSAHRGEVTRVVLTALRYADEPLTSHQLADRLMAERGLNTSDKTLKRTMVKRVGSALRDMRKKGRVRSEVGAKREMLWWLA